MEFIEKGIPLWKITIWDKRFNNVDNEWQPKTIKYNYLLSDELKSIKSEDGDVRILYTGKEVGYTTEELAGQNLSEGEIVSIPWGGIPSVKYHKGKFVTGDNRIATSSDVNRLTNKYLYYFLRGNIHEVASYYRGASLKHPNMKDILKMKISFPSIDIQEKICTQLDILELIIALRQKELLELDKLIRARFVEMFGDLVVNPYKWTVVKLSDISLFLKSGLSRRLSDVDIGLPVIRSGNIQNGQFVYNDIKYWYKDDPQGANTEDYRLENGDILVNFINSTSQIGKTAIFSGVNRECIYTTNILRMKLTDSCNVYYYNWFAMSDYYYRQLQNIIQPAVNQASFTTVNFLKLNIPLPPLQLQKQFETFVHQVNKSKFEVQKALDEAQLLFDSLMQKYFE